jgi:hypothetical protein
MNKITYQMADAFLNSRALVRATHERTDPLTHCIPAAQHCSRSTRCRNYRYLGYSPVMTPENIRMASSMVGKES